MTGGLGALGLQAAKVLVQLGAKYVVLLSRSGNVSYKGQGLEEDLQWLEEQEDVKVETMRCDVSDEASLERCLLEVRAQGTLSGIVHSAGVLKDALVRGGAAADGSHAVWHSKADSAALLHRLTRQDPIDTFVVFSSITSAIGNPGQTAYAGANAYLDALMSLRAQEGLPGCSIQWPAVSGIGMAADAMSSGNVGDIARFALPPSGVRDVLMRVLGSGDRVPSPVILVSPVAVFGPDASESAALDIKHQFAQVMSSVQARSVNTRTRNDKRVKSSAHTTTSSFTEEQVGEVVRRVIVSLLGDGEVDASAALMDQGLDSMGATELSSMLSSELGIRVLPTMLFSYPTVVDIIGHMCEELGITNATIEAVPARSTGGDESDLAIVGVACRYPGDVSSLSQLWSLMEGQTNTCREAPLSRWDTDALLAGLEGPPDASLESMRYGSFLSDEVVESFRSNMFGISDSEAKHMDATQRLLLDVSYEALADAGQSSLTDLKGSNTGVFIGASASSTNQQNICTLDAGSKCLSAYDATSANIAVAAGRISFVLGLEGPAITVDTACSSSLVAMHSARLSLSRGECDTAIVGGVNQLSASTSINAAKAGMLSTDGKCHSFDISANGYARGEGCGAFVVKRLSDAIRDGDGIYAVVRGSSVMQDGRSASLTAPSGRMQEKLIRTALRDAGVEPANVQYVQAHGTGTPLGDPIETGAIPLCMERAAK